jgi:RHS repeat-associated protein
MSKDGINYDINNMNEITALSDGTSFAYDLNGNRIQKVKGTDTWDYIYDHDNNLKTIEKNNLIIGKYFYGGDGNRLQKIEDSVTTLYIYSGVSTLYEENPTGSACYIYGPLGLIAKRTTIDQESNTYFYHKDHLGSIRLVTDSNKNTVSALTYHPYGEVAVNEGSEKYFFTGKERDVTELYYYGARYYDPQLGRFLTEDPLTYLPNDPRVVGSDSQNICTEWLQTPQKFNQYSYVINNPLRFIDPKGLSFTCADPECEALLNPPPPPPPPDLPSHIGCIDPECEDLLHPGLNDNGKKSEKKPINPTNENNSECNEECQRQKRLKK